jgi:hypothetical protein
MSRHKEPGDLQKQLIGRCQRLFQRLEFRLRKPWPMIGKGEPAVQQHKKNSKR